MRPPVYLVTNVRHFLGLASARAIRKRVPEATVVCHDRSFSDAAACAPFVDEGFEAMDGAVGGALGEAAVARHGGVDYLVSNDVFPAARVVAGEARGEEGLRVREACDALCAAPFELAGALAAGMRARRAGKMVFVTSAAPLRGLAHYAPYCAARGAANAMVRSLALELAPYDVTVNAVAPNFIATETYFPRALLDDPPTLAKIVSRVPLARLGTADEGAAAVDYLLSPGADFVTGTVLPVAGGWA